MKADSYESWYDEVHRRLNGPKTKGELMSQLYELYEIDNPSAWQRSRMSAIVDDLIRVFGLPKSPIG